MRPRLAAGAVLDRVRAEVVVGFGGYVAVPAYLAARRQGLTDPGRIAAMSARAPAADAPNAAIVLARHVLTAVAERRRFAP